MPPIRHMRLTSEIAARVPTFTGDGGRLAGRSDLITDDEFEQILRGPAKPAT